MRTKKQDIAETE